MFNFKKISVLGDGGWGTTLAILLSQQRDLKVSLWSPFDDYAQVLDRRRINANFLKGIKIPRVVRITSALNEALAADLVVIAVPSVYLAGVLKTGKKYYNRKIPVLSVVKGIDNHSLSRMSEVIVREWGPKNIAVLSGPTIAMELALRKPTTAVVSSENHELMIALQHQFVRPYFRIYTNADLPGVELGGSLKNIIAIACGISDGLGFGTNSKAAIVTRGLAEMARLGSAMGAKRETFFGVSGLGDLVTTCFNSLSRNHFVGERIGRGESLKKIVASMKMVAEGVPTAKSAYLLGKKLKVDLPITNEIYAVLYENKSPNDAVKNLMGREKKPE